jgi:hydrogenase/urease accessory protein HupE
MPLNFVWVQRTRYARWIVGAIIILRMVVPAWAHDPFSNWSILRIHPATIEVTMTMNAEAAWPFVQAATTSTAELNSGSFPAEGRPLALSFAATLLEIRVDGARLQPRDTQVKLADGNFIFQFTFPRPSSGVLRFTDLFVGRMPEGSLAHLTVFEEHDRQLGEEPLDPGYTFVEFSLPGDSSAAPMAASNLIVFRKFLKLGVEHILTGYDHLLFLCGLLIACRRLSTALTIITCFTVAHSVTLALSALNVFSLPSRIVEPLIAASIVFVGVENLLRRGEPPARWALTLGFGLVHGFGFASVLREIGLGAGGSSIIVPLFSFNLGVEIGQLSIALVALPIIWKIQRDARFSRRATAGASVLVTLAGTYWLLQRTVFSG